MIVSKSNNFLNDRRNRAKRHVTEIESNNSGGRQGIRMWTEDVCWTCEDVA
jgi:hypothetical protein